MNAHSTFQAPAIKIKISELIEEYIARRDGGEITRENADGTIDVIAEYIGVDAAIAGFEQACKDVSAECTSATRSRTTFCAPSPGAG